MKKIKTLIVIALVFFTSCSKDPTFITEPFVVAFKETSAKILEITETSEIQLEYSETPPENGTVSILIAAENAVYGRDFKTIPEAVGNELIVEILTGEKENSFQIVELSNSFTDVMKITFSIIAIDVIDSNIQGNSSFELSDSVSLGGELSPTLGGPNEPNQVYIDLSSAKETVVKRDTWDLGFYGGDEFRVIINGSLYMATAPLSNTDINSVNSTTVKDLQSAVAIGTFNPENENYIDAPNGSILETAIDEIFEDDAQNPVYLVNLGNEIGTQTPNIGSATIAGESRGWKKIRVLRNGEDYILQYADLDATSYTEVTISKDSDFNFSFFSFETTSIVNVEPQKNQWDLCFTVFTNVIDGAGSYGFSDYVIHNRKGGVTSYGLDGSTTTYDDFNIDNVDADLLEETQNIIGSNWRDVFTSTVTDDVFYILKDVNENYYKIRFLDLVNTDGERGYPRFEYTLLQ